MGVMLLCKMKKRGIITCYPFPVSLHSLLFVYYALYAHTYTYISVCSCIIGKKGHLDGSYMIHPSNGDRPVESIILFYKTGHTWRRSVYKCSFRNSECCVLLECLFSGWAINIPVFCMRKDSDALRYVVNVHIVVKHWTYKIIHPCTLFTGTGTGIIYVVRQANMLHLV